MASRQDSSELDRSKTTNDSVLDVDSKEAIVDQVVRMFTASKGTKNMGRQKAPAVPIDHVGPVPNVPVGTCWKYRWQVSEAGVHRPTVAGIHGREHKGAYSIVLSGVYEEDKDYGDYFLYSGCGGKEKDKTKRVSPQVYDQKLTRHNRGLALCCNAPVNDVDGADAGEQWRDGIPVRVVRKHSKLSIFAPLEGFRYDGIYKVVRYYPVTNQRSGLRVWTYELRRDDDNPAPWSNHGKQIIEELDLKMIVPEQKVESDNSYVCSQVGSKIVLKKRNVILAKKLRRRQNPTTTSTTHRYNFRLREPTMEEEDVKPDINKLNFQKEKSNVESEKSNFESSAHIPFSCDKDEPKSPESDQLTCPDMGVDINEDIKPDVRELNAMLRMEHHDLPVIQSTSSLAVPEERAPSQNLLQISPRKNECFWGIPQELQELIAADKLNRPTWQYLHSINFRTEEDFLNRVKIMFSCPVCSNIAREPITTPCLHNICLSCLEKNFEKRINVCPYCLALLPDIIIRFSTNIHLTNVLNFLFPSRNEAVL